MARWSRLRELVDQRERAAAAPAPARPARSPRRKPIQHEKKEQSWGVGLLTSLGAKVYVLGTRRPAGSRCRSCGAFVPNPDQSTRQTPGIADVLAFLPLRDDVRTVLWWEAKRGDGEGRERAAQAEFRALVGQTATAHVLGSYDDLIAWLVTHGYIKAGGVPHYRVQQQ